MTPEIAVDPVPSSSLSSKAENTKENADEDELAGRLAESRPAELANAKKAELDIGKNEAAYFLPSIWLLVFSIIVWPAL